MNFVYPKRPTIPTLPGLEIRPTRGATVSPECTCHLPNTAGFDYANFHDNHNETIGLK